MFDQKSTEFRGRHMYNTSLIYIHENPVATGETNSESSVLLTTAIIDDRITKTISNTLQRSQGYNCQLVLNTRTPVQIDLHSKLQSQRCSGIGLNLRPKIRFPPIPILTCSEGPIGRTIISNTKGPVPIQRNYKVLGQRYSVVGVKLNPKTFYNSLANMVELRQNFCFPTILFCSRQNDCTSLDFGKRGRILPRVVLFRKNSCIWPKLVPFGQNWLYVGKQATFG